MNHKEALTGLYPPVMTPFREDQAVDHDALAHNIEKMNDTGLRGYMPLGSNGEYRSLSDAESLEVVRTVKRHAAPDKKIMAGGGRESAYATVEFVKALCQEGVDFASILTPYYFASAMQDATLEQFFSWVADHSPLPVVLYCAPKFAAGVTISPGLAAHLALHPNILGIKDTSGGDIGVYCAAIPPEEKFTVLSGSINTYLDGLEQGASGGVLSPLNYIPGLCCEMESLYRSGKKTEAKALSGRLRALNKRTAGKYGVAGVKAAMDLLGYRGGHPRIPLSPLGERERAEMRAEFEAEGLLSR